MNMIALEERTQLFNLIFSVYSFNRFFIVLHHALISRTMFGFLRATAAQTFREKKRKIAANNWCAQMPVAQHAVFTSV